MAVYTKVHENELEVFLKKHDIGNLISFKGIEQGVENTNYHLLTTQGRYILTLFENRVNPADLPFFFAYQEHLAANGIKCPSAVEDKNGNKTGRLCGRPAAIITFLEGKGLNPDEITANHCGQLGAAVATMHEAAAKFPLMRPNSVSLKMWRELATKTSARAGEILNGLSDFIDLELTHIEENWPKDLPRAAVHADIFPDNVFFNDGKFSGIIDFYFTATDFLSYDLALIINAWCFDTNQFVPERFQAFMKAYEALRPMRDDEREALTLLCRGAAMRILMTRLHDWLFHTPDAFVKPKDPREYIEKLKFHQNGGLNE